MSCPECVALKARFHSVITDLENAEVELRGLRRENKRLKTEAAKQREEQPEHTAALELFEFWKDRCRHPKAIFGEKREKAVVARLKQGFTKRQIAEAIQGASIGAFRDPGTGVVYDDLELICRNEVQLEKFIARYEANQARTLPARMAA